MNNLKKVITILFVFLLAVAMVACVRPNKPNKPKPSTSESVSSETHSSEQISSESVSKEESSSVSSSESESESESESNLASDSGSESESESESETIPEPTPPAYEFIKPINDRSSVKTLVRTKYSTEGAVVVDAIATDYGADPTGERDSTKAIQSALNRVKNLGGGSVFLPIGKYLVTSTIEIPSYVSLVGDWNKPDADNTDGDFDYGTVILAKPQTLGSLKPQDIPLFSIGDSSGVVGLTFYYVDQDVSNVKKYGYTIYAPSPATATFKNLTFLNSAYGIGVSVSGGQNELVNVENLYGTFLFNAIRHNLTSDVGFYNNINV